MRWITIVLLALDLGLVIGSGNTLRAGGSQRRHDDEPKAHNKLKHRQPLSATTQRLIHGLHRFENEKAKDKSSWFQLSRTEKRHRLLENLNEETSDKDEDDTLARTIVIQGSVPPLFDCPSCLHDLEVEQESILQQAKLLCPSLEVIATNHKIANLLFVKIGLLNSDAFLSKLVDIPGVDRVLPQESYQVNLDTTVPYVGGGNVAQSPPYCLTGGSNIVVGILDTGIDYTHAHFGGNGTAEAYREAYGTSRFDSRTTTRDGLFPTERVIDGYDFVGEDDEDFVEDDDPVDGQGHGTAVASAILAMAPEVKLIAVKTCTTRGNGECPDFALIAGIEFLLDPNGDGDMEDRVDIINFSLGTPWTSTYYSATAAALEKAFEFGVLSVTAAGNQFNVPYVAGATSTSPNVISVGASANPGDHINGESVMESYSSRGPSENNYLKPDISAPARSEMAVAGSGNRYQSLPGTSFTAPLVAGAAALLMEKCPECSPFAIKAILMNHVHRNVLYTASGNARAPVSLMGSGELSLEKALEADFWAYSVEDVQPSISIGLVEAAAPITISRTIKVMSLHEPGNVLDIQIRSEFRDPEDGDSGALAITFDQDNIELGSCGNEILFEVSFTVDPAKTPPNAMTSGGPSAFDPSLLDINEFDGHIVVSSSNGKEVALPFHSILRRASFVTLEEGAMLPAEAGSFSRNYSLTNLGAGIAQIDAYDIIYTGEDLPEGAYGLVNNRVLDARTIGYRTIPSDPSSCGHVIELSIETWERQRHSREMLYFVEISPGPDDQATYTLFWDLETRELLVVNPDLTTSCTGFVPDHATNTANTVMRVCSTQVGLSGADAAISIRVVLYNPALPVQDSSAIQIPFPQPRLVAPSYDIKPMETLDHFTISGIVDESLKGMQLVTNAYRRESSTGAANPATETLVIPASTLVLPDEKTADLGNFLPISTDFDAPGCSWKLSICQIGSRYGETSASGVDNHTTKTKNNAVAVSNQSSQYFNRAVDTKQDGSDTGCELLDVPRLTVPTSAPSKSPTLSPTAPPTTSHAPSVSPSIIPTISPSASTAVPSQKPSTDSAPPSSGYQLKIVFVAAILTCLSF